jgi:DnaJ-class molecular chaperone
MKNYYKILGVLDDAEDIIIRAAYKALAQRYHPDKWTGDKNSATQKMAEINEAYEILSDSAKRKNYDSQYFELNSRNDREKFSNATQPLILVA